MDLAIEKGFGDKQIEAFLGGCCCWSCHVLINQALIRFRGIRIGRKNLGSPALMWGICRRIIN
jgi:hypothetical protein